VAERDQRFALSAEDHRRATAERDRQAAELSQRYAAQLAERERQFNRRLEDSRTAWVEEREEMRREMQTVMAGASAFVRREVLSTHGLSSRRPDGAIFDEDAVRNMLKNPAGGSVIPVVIPASPGADSLPDSLPSNSVGFQAQTQSPGPGSSDGPAPNSPEVPPEARQSAPARTTSAPADMSAAKPEKKKSGSFFSMFKSKKKSGAK
jgi:hypothetical protein